MATAGTEAGLGGVLFLTPISTVRTDTNLLLAASVSIENIRKGKDLIQIKN